MTSCTLCDNVGGQLLWNSALCRIVLVDDADYPGFCRIILNRHVKEMTDLDIGERSLLMRVLLVVESAVREVMHPDKVNLASLGNMTPHVHWHIIPRFVDDKHFPNPIWGEAQRQGAKREVDVERLRQALNKALQNF
jgi:diadenosine tetraphosphate (Ap4A) HIT family hydrolase